MRTYEEELDYYGKLVYTYEITSGTRMKNTYFVVPEGLLELDHKVHIDKVRKDIRAAADKVHNDNNGI